MKALKQEKRWCVWRLEANKDGKTTKIPYQPNGRKARSNDLSTWATYSEAKAALDNSNGYFSGIGLFFSGDLCGIDIDGDHEDGSRNAHEDEVRKLFPNTYAEKSPSGSGVHILFKVDKSRLPSETVTRTDGGKVVRLASKYYLKNPANGLEFYAGGLTNRFFTFTEDRISDSDEITDQTDAVLFFLDKFMIRPGLPASVPPPTVPSDLGGSVAKVEEAGTVASVEDGLRIARRAANREKFARLYDLGDKSEYNNDDSVADFALCVMLAFYLNKDASMIDEAFRKSALYRQKWDEVHGSETYGQTTIRRAIEVTGESYNKSFFKYRPNGLDLTDAGNAEVFYRLHLQDLRWCDALGWLVWNGQVWNADDHAAEALAMDFSEGMLYEAISFMAMQDGDKEKASDKAAKEYFMHAKKTRSAIGIKNMMTLAKARLAIAAAELDSDPYILNTLAGIVDLRTGEIRPHDPNAFCTKIAPFIPSNVGKEKWEDFLDLVTMDDSELKKYLQLVAGMSIIGAVKTEAIQIAYGGGRNGKTTYFNALQNVFGTYAGTLNADVLTTDRNTNKGASLATLRGKRYVLCGELEEGQRLSIKELKRVATTDRLVIEQKYKDPEEIKPSHHVCMFTNHLPRVGSTDNGTWRRLQVIPFNAIMPSGDAEIKDYAEVLTNEAGGAILLWALEGAREYLANGCKIKIPAVVKAITDEYRQKEDWLTPFIEEKCEVNKAFKANAGELYTAYKEFAQSRGDFAHNGHDFKEGLIKLGYKNANRSGWSVWLGIRLKSCFESDCNRYGMTVTTGGSKTESDLKYS